MADIKNYTLNLGPQHPAAHGVLRMQDDERFVRGLLARLQHPNIARLLDAVIEYLPAATGTERPAGEQEEGDDRPWSPL